jgi:hypothetical protein
VTADKTGEASSLAAAPAVAREHGLACDEALRIAAGSKGDLAPLSETRGWLERLLAELRPSPSLTRQEIDSLRFKLDALTPAVFESSLPAQALHGDASMSWPSEAEASWKVMSTSPS